MADVEAGIERRTLSAVQEGTKRLLAVTNIVNAEVNTAAYLTLDAIRANGILPQVGHDHPDSRYIIPSLDQERRDLSRVALDIKTIGFSNYPDVLLIAQIVGREIGVSPMIIRNRQEPDKVEVVSEDLIQGLRARPSARFPFPDAVIFMRPPQDSVL